MRRLEGENELCTKVYCESLMEIDESTRRYQRK